MRRQPRKPLRPTELGDAKSAEDAAKVVRRKELLFLEENMGGEGK